jgi:hypothetical protein
MHSNDFGITWNSSVNMQIQNGSCVTSSDSGRVVYICCIGDGIYKSEDYGQNWLNIYNEIYEWSRIATSSDGKCVIAVAKNNKIVVQSSNYGTSFTRSPQESSNPPGLSNRTNITGVCMSGSGQYQLCCVLSGQVCYSSNYGILWNYINLEGEHTCVAMSKNGKYYSFCRANSRILIGYSNSINTMYVYGGDNRYVPQEIPGAFYFNYEDNTLNVYNGTSWTVFQGSST